MIDEKHSPYQCSFCSGKTIRLSFSDQVKAVTEMRVNSDVDLVSDTNMEILDALLLPAIAPHGMVKCDECGKIQNVTYGMIGRTLFMCDKLPDGALPVYGKRER